MKKIAVIGAGTMGASIAQVFAMADREVVLADRSMADVGRGRDIICDSLLYMMAKEKISERQKDEILTRINFTDNMEECGGSDLVVEAIYENMEAKREMFGALEKIVGSDTILASNTSSLSITEIGNGLKYRERFLGMHFFNPANIMKLVEVVSGMHTAPAVVERIVKTAREVGKTPICVKEHAGFVVNRILIPMINEAIGVYADDVSSVQDIDTAMKLGSNQPIGPLALGDMIGLDVVLAIMEVLQAETGEDKYRPHPLLKKMVRGGLLGKKTKQGFYSYEK
ncbi:MAG: 3-hydroxyacyl-CoA dehydrogenase NAD-binding domain-containing protein [Christensenella sp.]|uniref:3-hydroxyacyl-CoA dehydrogenase family protein n=1 Tax=Christensenella sp. TaxID=1935934 RepID=UPI002B1EE537|nr:3-hydroxyacyl-CoA dehydrogenase NAD-binding domain-containing protein [Christensenella sp.]MEA5003520.1 3-hydroxyacyl-CoA dehydrogenase NAD-binding domain-containing protein [Christensenella sp.]